MLLTSVTRPMDECNFVLEICHFLNTLVYNFCSPFSLKKIRKIMKKKEDKCKLKSDVKLDQHLAFLEPSKCKSDC